MAATPPPMAARPPGRRDRVARCRGVRPGESEDMMSDLTEFLLARIAEDEAVVRAVPEAEPKSGADVFTSLSEPTGTVEMSTARILAECEAKRAIVEWFDSDDAKDFGSFADGVGAAEDAVLRYMILPHADHADYQEEWKP